MCHIHLTGKGTYGLLVEHIFIQLVAGAMACLVGDQRVVVDMLLLVGNDTAVAGAFCPLAPQHQVEAVARDAVVKRDDIVVQPAVGLLLYVDIAHTGVLVVGLFQTVEVE